MPEYTEGPKATENFEKGMKALFKVSKAAFAKAEKMWVVSLDLASLGQRFFVRSGSRILRDGTKGKWLR
jgi:hypothetical protein